MNSDHCQIVKESLTGDRGVDEQTFASLAILAERLHRLKALGMEFSDISFSPDVKKLARQKHTVLMG